MGRSYVLCFAMAKALPFSPPLKFTVSLHSVLHFHFLYHMYIREVSVVCYNSLCFLPLLKSLKFFIFFGIGISAWIYILWDVQAFKWAVLFLFFLLFLLFLICSYFSLLFHENALLSLLFHSKMSFTRKNPEFFPNYFCYFPMWYPWSGVALDCIVS